MKAKPTTYRSFLSAARFSSCLQWEETASIIQHFQPAQQRSSAFAPVTFLVDYATKKYIYVEESCFDLLGFTSAYFLETGLEDYLGRWHPADFHIMNTSVFPTNLSFLSTLSKEQYPDYIFSYNYRFQNPVGHYTNVLQRCSYIPGPAPQVPQGMVGVVFDISHFKSDASIVQTIEKVNTCSQGRVNELVMKKVYPLMDEGEGALLSKREIQIIQLMARGLSSKQIAAQTCLSIYTVNNHRKNILVKTAAKSSSEVINFAVKHGLV